MTPLLIIGAVLFLYVLCGALLVIGALYADRRGRQRIQEVESFRREFEVNGTPLSLRSWERER